MMSPPVAEIFCFRELGPERVGLVRDRGGVGRALVFTLFQPPALVGARPLPRLQRINGVV